MSFWDDKEIQSGPADYINFTNVGDTASGVITAISKQTFTDEKKGDRIVPRLTIVCDSDGAERGLTAGQWKLREALLEARPEVGDWVRVTMTGTEPAKIGKTKLFSVEHRKAADIPAAAPAQPAATVSAARASSAPPF